MKWFEKYELYWMPHEIIYGGGDLNKDYLLRWFLIPKNPILNIFLHKFIGDDRRTLHDHPWISISYQLEGTMKEHYKKHPYDATKTRIITKGAITYRRSTFLHYLTLVEKPIWTIFITGPKIRKWGFLHLTGWESAHKLFTREGIKRSAEQ